MKPKIGVVFPKITDKDIADLEIEKIRVSKNRRKIGILLGSDTSAYQQAKVEVFLGFYDKLKACFKS